MESNHEIIVPNKDLPFRMFLFEGANGNYVREKHWHRSIEIFAVLEGSLTFYLNDIQKQLYSGEFILVNSNEVHAIDAAEPNQTVVAQIPLQTFSDYFTGEQYIRFTHDATACDDQVMELISKMYQTYIKKATGYELQVKSSYYMLLYLLVANYREAEVNEQLLKQNNKLNRLTTITDYIQNHYKEKLSLESLAQTFGYTPSYLSRMFQKYAGINYKDYLQSVRVENAVQELRKTGHTISETALNNGFPNSKAFAKTFQKKYGMLPSTYREQI